MTSSELPVSEIMQREFVSLAASDHLDFVDDIMRLGRIRHMPVLEGERLVGIVSQRDLLSASLSKVLEFDPGHRRTFMRSVNVAEVMSKDVVKVEADAPIREVARLMIRHKIGCIPVVDESDTPIGLVTEVDLLRANYDIPEGSDDGRLIELHCFPESAALGRALARALGGRARGVRVHRFPDGESLVRVAAPVGPHAVLVRSLHQPNAKLVELLLAADALRRAGARRLTLVAPYLPYMRQDRVFRPGEPVSQRVLGGLLGSAFERVLAVEAHLHRIARLDEVVSCRARSFSAAPLIGAWCRRQRGRWIAVGPDAESEPWVRKVAREAEIPFAVAHKERLGDRRVRVQLPELPGEGAGLRALLVDDIASSGATLAAAARTLRRRGIEHVEAAVVHAIFAPGSLARIRRAGVARVISCDTVPHETNGIRVAPLLARALGRA